MIRIQTKCIIVSLVLLTVAPNINAGALKRYLDDRWGHLFDENRLKERFRNMMKRSYQWPATDLRYGNPPDPAYHDHTPNYPDRRVEQPWQDFRMYLYQQRLMRSQQRDYHRNRIRRKCFHPYRSNC